MKGPETMNRLPTYMLVIDSEPVWRRSERCRHGQTVPAVFESEAQGLISLALGEATPRRNQAGEPYVMARYEVTRDGETIISSYARRPFTGPVPVSD